MSENSEEPRSVCAGIIAICGGIFTVLSFFSTGGGQFFMVPLFGIPTVIAVVYIFIKNKQEKQKIDKQKIEDQQAEERNFYNKYNFLCKKWGNEGYNVEKFENLKQRSRIEIARYCEKIAKDIEDLKIVENELRKIKNNHPAWFERPEFQASVKFLESNIKNINKIYEVKTEFDKLKKQIQELEQISQQMDKLKK